MPYLLVSANDVMWDIDFAPDDQGALSCCIHEGLMCLFIVWNQCLRSANHKQQNSKHNNWLEILAGEDFPPKLLWRTPKFITSREDDDNKKPRGSEKIAWHSEGNVVNTATTNMYRSSERILQLHCKWNRWREGTPTADALKAMRRSGNA